MYVSRKLTYIKIGNIQFYVLNVYPNKRGHLIYTIKCHFFIAKTSKVRSNKMKEMYFKTFTIKVFVLILS